MRCVAADGEVINIVLHLYPVVYLQRIVYGEVVYCIVIMTHEVAAVEDSDEILHISLAVLAVDPEMLKLEIVHTLKLGKAESCAEIIDCIGYHLGRNITGFDKRGSVVRRRNRRERIHPVALAALKQRRYLCACRLCGRDLFRAAVCKQLEEQARRRAAEAVSDEIDFLLRAPALKKRLFVGYAVAIVTFGRRVRSAVVNRSADKLRIKLARSVPCSGERSDLSGIALVAL